MKTPTLADPSCTMASSMCRCSAPRLGKRRLPEVCYYLCVTIEFIVLSPK